MIFLSPTTRRSLSHTYPPVRTHPESESEEIIWLLWLPSLYTRPSLSLTCTHIHGPLHSACHSPSHSYFKIMLCTASKTNSLQRVVPDRFFISHGADVLNSKLWPLRRPCDIRVGCQAACLARRERVVMHFFFICWGFFFKRICNLPFRFDLCLRTCSLELPRRRQSSGLHGSALVMTAVFHARGHESEGLFVRLFLSVFFPFYIFFVFLSFLLFLFLSLNR